MQPVLVDLFDDVSMQYQKELLEMQHDELVRALFSIKGAMTRLSDETETKYPN